MGNSVSHGGFATELHRLGDYDQATAQLLHRKYLELDLEFGIDSSDLTKLLKAAEIEVSDSLVKSVMSSFPNKEILNVLDFLEGFCFLCKGDPEAKVSGCFDVFDFQSRGEISFDELTIMLMSVARGIRFLQGKSANEADDDKVAAMLRADLNQQQGMEADISKQQYLTWVKEKTPPFDASIDDFVDFCNGHPYEPDQKRETPNNTEEAKQESSVTADSVEEKSVQEAKVVERTAKEDEAIPVPAQGDGEKANKEPQPQEDSEAKAADQGTTEINVTDPSVDEATSTGDDATKDSASEVKVQVQAQIDSTVLQGVETTEDNKTCPSTEESSNNENPVVEVKTTEKLEKQEPTEPESGSAAKEDETTKSTVEAANTQVEEGQASVIQPDSQCSENAKGQPSDPEATESSEVAKDKTDVSEQEPTPEHSTNSEVETKDAAETGKEPQKEKPSANEETGTADQEANQAHSDDAMPSSETQQSVLTSRAAAGEESNNTVVANGQPDASKGTEIKADSANEGGDGSKV